MLPTLETDRLILRKRTMDDLEKCLEMDKDPEVTKYLAGVWNGGAGHIAFLEKRITKLYPANTLSGNDRSKKVMERLGMKYVVDFMYDGRLLSMAYEIINRSKIISGTKY